MHILLTDVLTCPRCGPEFGLIVLADRIEERRVIEGELGCANCREGFRIRGGVADLRHPTSPHVDLGPSDTSEQDPEARAFRAAALLGVPVSGATMLLVEHGGEIAARVAEVLADAHVIGASTAPPVDRPSQGVLSRIVTGERLPFRDASLRGAAVLGTPSADLFRETLRVLLPGARIVVERASDATREALRATGLPILLDQDGVMVAEVSGRG